MKDWFDLFNGDFDPKWTCTHTKTTEPDENGDAICLNCGTVVEIRLNVERFKKRIRKLIEGL